MNSLIRYVAAVGALALAGWALRRSRAPLSDRQQVRPGKPPAQDGRISRVEDEMREQAMLRARSEVASGEYDMQG